MDIQPYGSSKAIALYVVKYLSKSEPIELNFSVGQTIWQSSGSQNEHLKQALQNFNANTEWAEDFTVWMLLYHFNLREEVK